MKKSRWSNLEKKLLKEYTEKDLENSEIGKLLGKTPMSISKMKSRMGISINKQRWTDSEDLMLEKMWGKKPINLIAKKLNRSKQAVKKRALILGLGSQHNSSGYYLTTGDVSKILGIHPSTVRKKVLDSEIQAKMFGIKGIAQISPYFMLEYMSENIDKINHDRIDWITVKIYLKSYPKMDKENILKILTQYIKWD